MSNFSFNGVATIGRPGGVVKDNPVLWKKHCLYGMTTGRLANANDPVGTHTLNITNIVAGSRLHIESQDGTTVHYDAIVAGTTASPTIDVYSAGNAKNNWRIRLRKASAAPYYKPYESLMTATVGSSSLYAVQIPDS